jgi:hypothetical protein
MTHRLAVAKRKTAKGIIPPPLAAMMKTPAKAPAIPTVMKKDQIWELEGGWAVWFKF